MPRFAHDTAMKRLNPKTGISQLSRKPADKLMACLNHGVNVSGAAYMQDPNYFRCLSAVVR